MPGSIFLVGLLPLNEAEQDSMTLVKLGWSEKGRSHHRELSLRDGGECIGQSLSKKDTGHPVSCHVKDGDQGL